VKRESLKEFIGVKKTQRVPIILGPFSKGGGRTKRKIANRKLNHTDGSSSKEKCRRQKGISRPRANQKGNVLLGRAGGGGSFSRKTVRATRWNRTGNIVE